MYLIQVMMKSTSITEAHSNLAPNKEKKERESCKQSQYPRQ